MRSVCGSRPRASHAAWSAGSASRIPAPPIGIQPSAYSATAANSFGPAAPPMSTGGPFGVAGLGHDHDGENSTNLPWYSPASSRHSARIASRCSRARSRRVAIVHAVVLGLVGVPTEAHTEHEPTTRLLVERRDRLRGDDRLPLRDETDAGADDEPLRDRSRDAERDERVERVLVLVGELRVAGRGRRDPARRDVRVLREVQRVQAAVLDRARELRHADRLVRCEHRDAELHAGRVPSRALPRSCRHRHRSRSWDRPRTCARVRARGRQGRRQRPRRRERRDAAAISGPAQDVVDEIVAAGGEAVANTDDIADWEGARHLVESSIETFGALDVLVNNAGFLRDRMLFTTSEEEWDAVIRVHLKGHFAPTAAREPSTGGRGRKRVSPSTPASSTRLRAPGSWAASGRARTRRPRPASRPSRWSKRPRWRATA